MKVNGWEEHYREKSFLSQCKKRFGTSLGETVWEVECSDSVPHKKIRLFPLLFYLFYFVVSFYFITLSVYHLTIILLHIILLYCRIFRVKKIISLILILAAALEAWIVCRVQLNSSFVYMVLSTAFLVECIVDLKWLKRFCYDYNDDVNSNVLTCGWRNLIF